MRAIRAFRSARVSLPATTDYWVNDKHGDPLFVVTAEFNEGLVHMLPVLLKEVRALVGPRRRVTVVFDRGGWSPKLFAKLIQARFDILTYRKGRWKDIPAMQFVQCAKRIDGRKVTCSRCCARTTPGQTRRDALW